MKRLLCILNSMNTGGAETFMMKVYNKIDCSKYQIDFCVTYKETNDYEEEILKLGGKIYKISAKTENPLEFKRQLTKLIQKEKYKYVLRITSNAVGFYDLKIAKNCGAEVCCARSSNSSDGNSFTLKIMHLVGRFLWDKYIDVRIAPSDLAAKYTFGYEAVKKKIVKILPNGLDLDYYRYDPEKREKKRKELGLTNDTFIVGHIGRFCEQKNHSFLLDIFKKVKEQNEHAILLLVGIGPLEDKMRKKVFEMQLSESVIFAGLRSDVPDLLCAMDVYVFPSFYEGMPNTVIEAQAAGLQCIISDTITQEANITDQVRYLSLNDNVEIWANNIVHLDSIDRLSATTKMKEKHYDIESVANAFVSYVFLEPNND